MVSVRGVSRAGLSRGLRVGRAALTVAIAMVMLVVLCVIPLPVGDAQAAATPRLDPTDVADIPTEAAGPSGCFSSFAPYLRQLELVSGEVRAVAPGAERVDGVPTVLVHGWMATSLDSGTEPGAFSGSAVWLGDSALIPSAFAAGGEDAVEAEPSLAARLLTVPNSSVFVFDYESLGAQWIGEKTGNYLAGSLDCLFNASGQRVNIVAHSMGGLAVRFALAALAEGADHIGQVVTIAAPNLGSDLASLLGDVSGANIDPAMLSLFLQLNPAAHAAYLALTPEVGKCLDRTRNDVGDACLADFPLAEGALTGAAVALRTGSPELESLPDWPTGVRLHAIAGSIDGLVDSPLLADALGFPRTFGDIVVPVESALDGATSSLVVTCPASTVLPDLLFGPCAHNGLLRNVTVIDSVVRHVADAVDLVGVMDTSPVAELSQATAGVLARVRGAREPVSAMRSIT